MGNILNSGEKVEDVEKEPIPVTLTEKENAATVQLMEEIRDQKLHWANISDIPVVPIDNSEFPYSYKRLDIPYDEDGFVEAFTIEQPEEITNFFGKYGFVVVKDLLTEEECKLSEDEIWEFMGRCVEGINRYDTSTWHLHWPALKHLGILGNDVILSKQMMENRQNEKVFRAFEIIFGHGDLIVDVGRASAMRPTRNVLIPESDIHEKDVVLDTPSEREGYVYVDRPHWKTKSEWIHWDMHPWNGWTSTFAWKSVNEDLNVGYDRLKVQGILSVIDCGPNDGGFHCIPGFQDHIRGWANANLDKMKPTFRDSSYQVPEEDPIRNDCQKCPIRKGSLLVWDSSLPHGTFPNDSENMRMIQYIKMADARDKSIGPLFSRRELLPDDFVLSELGDRIIFGEQ
jgi:hypothetical protein